MAISDADARHFLGRVGFIPSEDEVAHFSGREIPDVVDEIVDALRDTPGTPGWLDGSVPNYEANGNTVAWWLNRMTEAKWINASSSDPHPLIEKMAMFWHGHFATAFRKVGDAPIMFEQNQILRAGALGNFEALCADVSLHGAMIVYLDNETNVVGAVQENFARELMELFTMGVGNYSESDVVSMARAWTGHGIVGWIPAEQRTDRTYLFRADRHDNLPKSLFGLPAQNWDARETITEICTGVKQIPTSRFITSKLWKFFVNDSPPAGAVDDLAAVFRSSDMSIRELMRALLNRPELWAVENHGSIVKSPAQFVVDFNRCTNLVFTDLSANWFMPAMGQELFAPPNVAGWGTHGYWLSTATMWGRAHYATNRRWKITQGDPNFLADLETLDSTTGTNRLLEQFRIFNPSPSTTAAVGQWFSTTKTNYRWALPAVGISVAALTPEFQVA